MDLKTLAEQLKTQAQKNNSIVLDETLLSSEQLSRISLAFVLGEGKNLTVDGVKPTDIPDPTDDALTVEVGASSLLNQQNIPLKLIFTVSDNQAQALIAATMPASWGFKDSFPDLVQFPFSKFTVTDSCFIYAPAGQLTYAPWADKPQETIPLEAGLNFAGWLKLDGFSVVLNLLADIIGEPASYKFFGPFAPTADAKYPVGALSALLSTKDFSIGYDAFSLTVSRPAFVTQINKPDDSVQDIDLNLQAISSLGLDFSMGISSTGDSLTFGATPAAGVKFTADKIPQLLGGHDFKSFIPSEIEEIFAEVALEDFTLVMLTQTKKVGYINLTVGTPEPWDVLPDVIKLESIALNLAMTEPSGDDSLTSVSLTATAQILKEIFTGNFTFYVDIQKDAGNEWQVASIDGQYIGAVKLSDIIHGIAGTDTPVPEELSNVVFSDFGISVDKTHNSYVVHGSCGFGFPLLDSWLSSTISIQVNHSSDSSTVALNGALTIGEQDFALKIDFSKQKAGQDVTLNASWTAQDGHQLELADIASAFGLELPEIPEELDLALKSASLTYYFTGKNLVIEVASANYGNAVFAAFKNTGTGKSQFYFGLDIGKTINLTDLPLVKGILSQQDTLDIEQIQIIVSSDAVTTPHDNDLITKINNLITVDYPKVSPAAAGFGLSMVLNAGGQKLPFGLLSAAGDKAAAQSGQLSLAPAFDGADRQSRSNNALAAPTDVQIATDANAGTTQSGDSSSTKWFDVQKQFGVFQFKRIGIGYQNNTLLFLLDAAVTFGSLKLSMQGLSAGSPLTSFEPKFDIGGLGLTYNNPPLEIAGAFLKVPENQLGQGVDFQFDGTAILKSENYNLAAVGSYAKLAGGEPSLFIFAQLETALGGPTAFFITGLMAGFGYNRKLEIPAQDEVLNFPLLALGQAKEPTDVLNNLEGNHGTTKQWIHPSTGDYWLAVGIDFTSFELVYSQALLIVEFGSDFQVTLLGISKMCLPKAPVDSPPDDSYAYVEMQLKAVFRPQDGFLGLTAILSGSSYVISKDCHLTGGYAFYVWFGSNENAGQFVVTMGGYHPAFTAPGYFPQVPRLGFNWAVSDSVSVKGDAYYALTASCVMAGGGLEILYQDGDLSAWFTAHADMLLSWHPFFFDIRIDVEVGASYRLNLLFCHKTVSVSVGATVYMQGPPTGGSVRIHLSILSFTVYFGSDSDSPQDKPLEWADFKNLLPHPEDVCKITVSTGLYKIQDGKTSPSNKLWIVRVGNFGFFTQSSIPASQLQYNSENTDENFVNDSPAVNIRPMNKTGIASIHNLKIYKESIDADPVKVTNWTLTPRHQDMPESLWGEPPSNFSQIPDTPTADVKSHPVGYTVQAPPPNIGSTRGLIPLKELAEDCLYHTDAPLSVTVAESADYVPDFYNRTVGQIEKIMGDAKDKRNNLFNALQSANLYQGANGALDNMAKNAGDIFSDSPMRQS
jgi:hypothetical protein